MKLSQIEKRIPQTLTNSKDIIQTDREYACRSSRARSTRGQENEAWALYKKRVSFIDLYLVFPRNFRMVFLPHTNTVILLKPYCGTITEPGLPVAGPDQREAKKMRPGHCTKKLYPGSPEVTFLGTDTSFAQSHPPLLENKFVKVCGICLSIWESYICCYPISTILACLFSVGVRISWKKLC